MITPHWANDPTSADDYSRMVDDAADEARDRAYLADDTEPRTAHHDGTCGGADNGCWPCLLPAVRHDLNDKLRRTA